MSWEYFYLKRKLGLPEDRLLQLFEAYCADSYQSTERMEWSWKIAESSLAMNRFVHVSKVNSLPGVLTNIQTLLRELNFNPEHLSLTSVAWDDLLDKMTERVVVAYAGPNAFTKSYSVIKVYLAIRNHTSHICEQFLLAHFNQLRNLPLIGNPGILIGFSLNSVGQVSPRVYIFYDAVEYSNSTVRSFVAQFVSPHGLHLLRSYPRSAISLKSDGTDMLYVSLSERHSEIRTLVADMGERDGNILERTDRVTWVGLPIDYEFYEPPKELNAFVELRSS